MEKIIIIPAYNPDEKLKEIVDRNWELETLMILVDDGSDEKYQQLFWELKEKSIVLHHECNQGKGAAVKTALEYIKNELWQYAVIGIMDADGQHLPEDMNKLLMKAYNNQDALVLGVREIDENMPWKSRMGNKITRGVFHILSGVKVSDTQTGMRAFSPKLLKFMQRVPGQRYEYETNVLFTCAKHKIKIIEVPIHTIYHDKGNSCSHFRKVRDSVRIYFDILKFGLASFSSLMVEHENI